MQSELILRNKTIYDRIAPRYERQHVEIFNQAEQERIRRKLAWALSRIDGAPASPLALDFGSGTGNLTRHLLELGAHVVAADISEGCLSHLVDSVADKKRLSTLLLSGHDLSQFADESFDMVATYSVLHHVPDYLAIVNEFVRVVKPGGIVYIDHEVCPAYWENRPEYQEYCREVAESLPVSTDSFYQKVSYVFRQKNRLRYLLSSLRERWSNVADEGDIHVHADDHIEWTSIRSGIEPFCEILREQDYLVCRELTYPAPVWEKWRSHCVDMRLLVAEKR